jgi:hypothetical protein
LIIGVVVAVWISLSRAFGSPDPSTIPTPPRSNMPVAEAFYLLWSVLALVIVWVFPLFIRSVRIVWQRRVMIIVACAVLAISFLLAGLAGASDRGPGKAPGFWGVQHDYMFFPIALFLIIAINIARYSSNRYRGLWNLNYAVTEPQTLRVLEQGIENETPFRLYRIQYVAIRQWYETPNVFVLFSGDRLTIIPKRAMGSLTESKRFRETMAVKLSGRTFAFPVQAVHPIQNKPDLPIENR